MGSKRRGSRGRKVMKGYKSKTQVIAHNEARSVVKANLSRALEKKRWDGQTVYLNMPVAGSVVSLFTDPSSASTIGSGVGAQGVVGDTVTPTKIRIRMAISYNPTPANVTWRVVVIQSRGTWAGPIWGDFVQSTTDNTMTEFSQSTVQGKGGRFRILYDKRGVCTTASAPQVMTHNILIPKRKLIKTKFAAGTPIAISDGNLWIAYCSDNAVSPAQIKYYSSLFYTDA